MASLANDTRKVLVREAKARSMKQVTTCCYCGKDTVFTDNKGRPVCESEWVCEDTEAPSFTDEYGDDPLGKDWL